MRPPPTAHRTPAATSPDLTGESRVRIHGAHGWREFEWSNGAVHRYEWKHFEVCCIPFFLYDVSLGDVVATNPDYVLDRVVRASGRYTFRVQFGDGAGPKDQIAAELELQLGALLEWHGANLLAVDAADGQVAQTIADYLQARENAGQLTFETGRTAVG